MKNIIYIIVRKIYNVVGKPILAAFFWFFPIKKGKIVFDNFGGNGYGDNPKFITEEILKRNLGFEIVWVARNVDGNFPYGVKVVKYNSLKSYFEFATAEVWIDNIRNSVRPLKKKKQIYVQTWHGPYGPKLGEKAAYNLSDNYIKSAKYDGSITNAIISSSELQDRQYKNDFWLSDSTEILRIGLPRNDVLFDKQFKENTLIKIRECFSIPQDTSIILYMPTFRDDLTTAGYQLEFDRITDAFEKRFNKEFVLLVRFHPNVKDQHNIIKYSSKIMDATMYEDAQELYVAADFLISDYSCTPLDFSLLHRPSFLCSLDLENYKKFRGLDVLFEELPYVHSYSNQELIDRILNFDEIEYWENYEKFWQNWRVYERGNASEKLVDWLMTKLKIKNI